MRQAEYQALKRLLAEKRIKLMPDPPKASKRVRSTQRYADEVSAWQEECDQIDTLLEEFNSCRPTKP